MTDRTQNELTETQLDSEHARNRTQKDFTPKSRTQNDGKRTQKDGRLKSRTQNDGK